MKIVVKLGGNAMSVTSDGLLRELAALRGEGHAVVLVHGGGPEIDAALSRAGVSSHRVDGLRYTGADAIAAVEAVLCATVNKRLVRACLHQGIQAVGISGQDGGFLECLPLKSGQGADLGFVGDVTTVNPALIETLLRGGFLPVVAPLAIDSEARHAYNVNADTAAGAIAGKIEADAFVSLTNVPRVYRDPARPDTAIDRMSAADARLFAASDGCAAGMKPKILAAAAALASGARYAYIGSAKNSIAAALSGDATVVSP